MIIDFSAHSTWDTCPAKWYERYVAKRMLKWPKAQRNDALCLGGLTHAGLQVWQESHVVEIPAKAVDEYTPDKETHDLALELVYGYARKFPEEQWPLVRCEEPVTMPLVDTLTLLAKIDEYFYVPESTVIDTGAGQQMVLNPGWWIQEYKTKAADTPIGIYMQSWEMGLQAAYQILALQWKLANQNKHTEFPVHDVQGVLVNVLEKPKRYVPKRKCGGCRQLLEFARWLPTFTGEYACPECGNRQKLQPLKLDTPTVLPEYYRFPVTRQAWELEQWKAQIITVGQRMIQMAQNGLHSEPWRPANCVDLRWRKACEYFGPHKNGTAIHDDPTYVDVPEYRGLVEIQ